MINISLAGNWQSFGLSVFACTAAVRELPLVARHRHACYRFRPHLRNDPGSPPRGARRSRTPSSVGSLQAAEPETRVRGLCVSRPPGQPGGFQMSITVLGPPSEAAGAPVSRRRGAVVRRLAGRRGARQAAVSGLPGPARLPGRGSRASRAVGCLGWRAVLPGGRDPAQEAARSPPQGRRRRLSAHGSDVHHAQITRPTTTPRGDNDVHASPGSGARANGRAPGRGAATARSDAGSRWLAGSPAEPSAPPIRRDSRSPARCDSMTGAREHDSGPRRISPRDLLRGLRAVPGDQSCPAALLAARWDVVWPCGSRLVRPVRRHGRRASADLDHGRRAGALVYYCDACSREHLRSIEAKLDSEYW